MENQTIVIAIENTRAYADILADIYYQTEGGLGDFILSECEKEFLMSKKACFVDNPYRISCNDKRILSKLYKELEETTDECLPEEKNKLLQCIVSFVDNCIQTVPYNLSYDFDIGTSAILKLCNVEFVIQGSELIDSIVNYIKAMHQILGIEIIFFSNLKLFLNEEELMELYKECYYEKVFLILIEGIQSKKLEEEKCCILDKDLCIIKI